MAEEHTCLTRFVLGGRHFYFRTSWRDTDFEIDITDGRQVWHGHAEEEFIENSLKPGEMELQEYMQLTKRALTVQDVTKKHFSYRLSQGQSANELHLTWRIKLGHDAQVGFSVKGTLPLFVVKDGRPIVQQCLDSLIDRQTVLERANKELRTQNDALFSQRDNALTQLSLLVQEKKAMEQDLYQKFVQVLNEKKKKIRELKSSGSARALSVSDEEDARWSHQTSSSNRSGITAVQEDAACDESEDDGENAQKGTFSLTGPTPSLSLLGGDGEYSIRTSVRKRHRPTPVRGDRESASKTASTSTALSVQSLKEKLMTTPQRNAIGNQDASFIKPAKKKARTEPESSSSIATRKPATKVASAATNVAARASKRKSVSAEDLLDMCQ